MAKHTDRYAIRNRNPEAELSEKCKEPVKDKPWRFGRAAGVEHGERQDREQ
jgi:hypothetical protein